MSTAGETVDGISDGRAMPNVAGVWVGRYRVGERIGSGAGGTVHSAYDPQLERTVALKLLRSTKQSEAEGQRFVREAQFLARLKHPHIVTVHEVGVSNWVYLAMEHVEGPSLDKWLQTERRSAAEIIRVFVQAGEGLLHAHEQDLVHRDFKPANVLVTAKGQAKVIDFGLAQFLGTEPPSSAGLEAVETAVEPGAGGSSGQQFRPVGTPAYMAPEQFQCGRVTHQSDQFSFCVALWEALYGQRPFVGDSCEELERHVCAGAVQETPADREVPSWLGPILRRGLSVTPGDRWPSMTELLAALRNDPTRRRRIVGLSTLGVAALAAGLGGWQLKVAADTRATVATCERSGAAIDALWNGDVKERVRKALLATGVAYAPTTFDKVLPWLDDFSRAWKTTYTGTCLETRLEGKRSAESFAGALECLEGQWTQFAAFMQGLEEAGPTAINKAVDAATNLPKPELCADIKYLSIMPRLPLEPGLRARAKEIAARQADASMFDWLGDYDHGLALARRALADARGIEDPHLIANGHYQIASFLRSKGDYSGAEAEHQQAFLLAGSQGNDDLAATNAIQLGFILASNLARPGDADLWNSIADMTLKRAGDEHGLKAATLRLNLASLDHLRGDYAKAVEHCKTALEIREGILGPDHPYVGGALNNLATNYVALERLADAQATFERVYEHQVTAMGADHPDTGVVLSNLAYVQGNRGDWVRARTNFARAHAVLERAFGPEHAFVVSAKNNLAGAAAELGDHRAALSLQYQALAVTERQFGGEHPQVALLLNNIAANHMHLAEYEQARRTFERAIEIREKVLTPDHPDLAVTITSLAALELGQDNLEAGAKLHERALRMRERKLPPEHPALAYNYYGLADYHLKSRRVDTAIKLFRRSLALRTAALEASHPLVATSLNGLGEALIESGEYDEAVAHLERALEIRTERRTPVGLVARAQFHLGQALWGQGADRDRARSLVEAARDGFAAAPPSSAKLRAEAESWLRNHRAAPPRG